MAHAAKSEKEIAATMTTMLTRMRWDESWRATATLSRKHPDYVFCYLVSVQVVLSRLLRLQANELPFGFGLPVMQKGARFGRCHSNVSEWADACRRDRSRAE